MPDESCRKCGKELIKCSICSKCRKTIQWICSTCVIKTGVEFHPTCLHLENYQVMSTRNQQMVVPYNHVTENSHRVLKNGNKNRNFLFMGLAIIVGCIVVVGFANDNIFSKIINETGDSPILNYQYYDNCLAQANGENMTINCPTAYGAAYKTVTSIPNELASQLEEKDFSLRGISTLESHDTLILEYHKKMYAAAVVNHLQ